MMKGKKTGIWRSPLVLQSYTTKEKKLLSLFEFHQRYLFIYKGIREK